MDHWTKLIFYILFYHGLYWNASIANLQNSNSFSLVCHFFTKETSNTLGTWSEIAGDGVLHLNNQ